MCISQNELILLIIIIIILIYIIYHKCDLNESFAPTFTAETCNLNNEGFICSATCKVFGKGYYVNKGQGCNQPCVCP